MDIREYDPALPVAGAFFVGWPSPPSEATWRRFLEASSVALVAVDGGQIVGYLTVLTDGVLFASITSLEVLPLYQGRGVGRALMSAARDRLRHVYAVDLVCDETVVPFYETVGMVRLAGMGWRNYARQSGSERT